MMKLLAVCVLVCLGVVHGNTLNKRGAVDKGTHIEICEQEPIELGIVLDSSRSIKAQDFVKTKQFLSDFLAHFDIGTGHDDVRVCLIPFGYGIYPQHGFNLTTYPNKEDLLASVLNIHHEKGGRTDTGDAIKYMHDHQMTPSVTRSWAEKIVVVITDGNSQRPDWTQSTATDARGDNITIFAVGIGSVSKIELIKIAGLEDHVTQVKSFDSLDSVKGVLAKKTCIRKEKPTTTTTTPMPQTACGELDPADVNFVFSPADLGLDGTAWTTSFISNVVDTEDMDIGFRYGVVSGSCPDDAGFALDRYREPNALRERVMQYDGVRISRLASETASRGFSTANGGRPGVKNVAVLFAAGGKKGSSLTSQVAELTAQGIEVFIASPNGRAPSVRGATSLYGTSSRQQSEDFIARLCPY